MTVLKRIVLIVLTIFAVTRVFLSLGESVNEPQIQSRLELYQTALVLQASEYDPPADGAIAPEQWQTLKENLFGEDPYAGAIAQHQKALGEAEKNQARLEDQLRALLPPPIAGAEGEANWDRQRQQLTLAREEWEGFQAELRVKMGLLAIAQGNQETALAQWAPLVQGHSENPESAFGETATLLAQLYQDQPLTVADPSRQLQSTLDQWFLFRSLRDLYRHTGNTGALAALQTQEQAIALRALGKLVVISGVPFVGGLGGIVLLVGLLIQWATKKDHSVLGINGGKSWETPWSGEITWQVLIVGFFAVGQIFLPLLFGLLNLRPSGDLRTQAVYVLVSYGLMAAGGLGVLFYSLKPFLPLPQDWFRASFQGRWGLWGVGGYLVAIPTVLVVSLVNQQLWQGQGGSNPLISLALKSQDWVALGIFFFTASIAAPIFEEIMFRGFLLPSLTRYCPVWLSVVISSVIFAGAHLSVGEILPLTALGMILAVVYTRSRNLLAPMLLHCLWNSGTLFSLFLLGSP